MAITNVGEELIEAVKKTGSCFKCAVINFNGVEFKLVEGYSFTTFIAFIGLLKSLAYDNGYGGQELYGTVWLLDGTWLDRGEYDGSEWWEHRKAPEIPIELRCNPQAKS